MFLLRKPIVPSKLDSMKDESAIWAAPPMWKVRMVSCVPGSPIDCAAMTPTASPWLTGRAAGEVAAVAGGADAVLRLADEHGADLHLLDAGGADRLEMLLLDHRALSGR